MSEKTIITTTLVGSHVCIAEEDYDLLTLSANVGYALEKENALLREQIEAKDKEIKVLSDNLSFYKRQWVDGDDEGVELKARNELVEKVLDGLFNNTGIVITAHGEEAINIVNSFEALKELK